MIKRILFITMAATAVNTARADIFKCMVDGKAVYQAGPCTTEKDETALNIKRVSPEPTNMDGYAIPVPGRDSEKSYLEKKLLKARIAAEQAEAARRQALAEAEITRANARAREADAWSEHLDAEADADAARAEAYERMSRRRHK